MLRRETTVNYLELSGLFSNIKYAAEITARYRIMQRVRNRYLTSNLWRYVKHQNQSSNFADNFANNLCVRWENKATRVVLAELAKFKRVIFQKNS